MAASSLFAVAVLALSMSLSAALKLPGSNNSVPITAEVPAKATVMNLRQRQFMEVKLGPFASAAEACDYCFTSFTKEGVPPAGPVASACICMAYPDAGGHNMFCATPASAAGYVAEKGGCRCKARNMEEMGATTCEAIN
eukprot:TRINITY_DN1831_c0_g1_i6.p2 TRINITY_DN1831_c0_g1~~TRINITY_DN1831_c0_g1_i6.p2  ORF type:complete len:161 (-),score=32.03 TRINITY_DN1831_c0_g1_i6:270-686(-)